MSLNARVPDSHRASPTFADMKYPIPVVDLFAGPGGLGEGFSCFLDDSGEHPYSIGLSVEKDPNAYHTLETRAFFRHLERGSDASDYFRYLRKEITREELFARHEEQVKKAKSTCWLAELGRPDVTQSELSDRIDTAVNGNAVWVLIGGPPCQAYSVIGRSRVRSVEPERYENDTRHFLYREYLRIVADHLPPVFVMENVKGLLSTKVNGSSVFAQILRDLGAPRRAVYGESLRGPSSSYVIFSPVSEKMPSELRPKDYVVRAESYGIPQKRHRVFLLGIRSDVLPVSPSDIKLTPQRSCVSAEEVLSDLPRLRSGLSGCGTDSLDSWLKLKGQALSSSWAMSNNVDSEVIQEIRRAVSDASSERLTRGEEYIRCDTKPLRYQTWYVDPRLAGVCNHSTRSHIPEDLHRYLFAASFASVHGYSPSLDQYPTSLLPQHKNVILADGHIIFSDRLRVQVKGRPASTVTSHISKDGHYYIHYDPTQCRSLTVREVARLQTFPDNYLFEGPRTSQYLQVGNAVPPFLARHIAEAVHKIIAKTESVGWASDGGSPGSHIEGGEDASGRRTR